ncbi:MAG: hypothetical protein AB7J28_05785 [Hyphomonadaceae bacterium]
MFGRFAVGEAQDTPAHVLDVSLAFGVSLRAARQFMHAAVNFDG